jgi:hypothetical protein
VLLSPACPRSDATDDQITIDAAKAILVRTTGPTHPADAWTWIHSRGGRLFLFVKWWRLLAMLPAALRRGAGKQGSRGGGSPPGLLQRSKAARRCTAGPFAGGAPRSPHVSPQRHRSDHPLFLPLQWCSSAV